MGDCFDRAQGHLHKTALKHAPSIRAAAFPVVALEWPGLSLRPHTGGSCSVCYPQGSQHRLTRTRYKLPASSVAMRPSYDNF